MHDISPYKIQSAHIQTLITHHWNLKLNHIFGPAMMFSIFHSADSPLCTNTGQNFFSHWGGKSVNISSCCNPVTVTKVSTPTWHYTKILKVKGGDIITTSSYSSCTSCGSHSNKTLPSVSASQSCPSSVSSLALKPTVWHLSKPAGHILFFLLGIFSLLLHSKPTLGFRICSLLQCVHTISFHSIQTCLPSDLSWNSLSLNTRTEHIYWIKPLIYPWCFNHQWSSSWTTMFINICCVLTHINCLTQNTGKNNNSNCTSALQRTAIPVCS
jgi:hypothetical protein